MTPKRYKNGIVIRVHRANSDAKLLCEVLFDLLQPVQAVLDLQVNLRPLKMVSMIANAQKRGFGHQYLISSMLRS